MSRNGKIGFKSYDRAGRLHREYEGKQDVQIYDYIDIRVPICESMYRKRLKGYSSIGYRIRNNEAFDSLFPITDVIYDGQNFESPFISDLSKAKQSVVVSCPNVKNMTTLTDSRPSC